nr:M15 family metallopeptidase [Gordonia effusa]
MSTHRVRRRAIGLGIVLLSAMGVVVGSPSALAEPSATRLQQVDTRLAPGTAGLTPTLARAYTRAHNEARRQGVTMWITSGKRSVSEQRALWRDGIARYGSPGAARRWVLPPNESTHVTGDAIDVGPHAGAAWLQVNGRRWGLCRTFDNEWWHFERATLPGLPCPRRIPDASSR